MIPHKYIVSDIVTRDIAVEMNIVLDINFTNLNYFLIYTKSNSCQTGQFVPNNGKQTG